jgi:hypothetical protein
MHLKVFLKLKNPKNSFLGKYIKKNKKPKKTKKPTGLVFFFNLGFFQSCLHVARQVMTQQLVRFLEGPVAHLAQRLPVHVVREHLNQRESGKLFMRFV